MRMNIRKLVFFFQYSKKNSNHNKKEQLPSYLPKSQLIQEILAERDAKIRELEATIKSLQEKLSACEQSEHQDLSNSLSNNHTANGVNDAIIEENNEIIT